MDLDIKQSLRQLERRLAVMYAIGLILLSCLALFSTQVLKYQAADQVSSLIRRMIKLGDLRETVFTLGQANLDHFEEISYFNSSGQKMFSLPPKVELNSESLRLIDIFLHGRIENDLFLDGSRNEKLGSLEFTFNRMGLLPIALGIWLLFVVGTLPLVVNSRKQIVLKVEGDIKIKGQLVKAEIARKVRHDIRSPLFALQSVMAASTNLTGREKSVLQHAATRIVEIVKELEDQPQSLQHNALLSSRNPSVPALVEDIYQEKLAIVPKHIIMSLRLSDSAFYGYTDMNAADLGRVLSNVIDNAIESIGTKGTVEVSLESDEKFNVIVISDSGRGISEEHLAKIWEKNFTFGKANGEGIGLYYAKNVIESAGGTVDVTSAENVGTQFKIKLPIRNQPPWIVKSIPASKFGSVVVVDDQKSVHSAWDLKVSISHPKLKLTHLYSPQELGKWIESNDSSNVLYLLDYDLKASETGLMLVSKYGLQESAILVTGHYDDENIKTECARLGVKLLPKSLISSITVA